MIDSVASDAGCDIIERKGMGDVFGPYFTLVKY